MTSPDWNRSPDGNRKWHPYPARAAFIVLHNAAESAVCAPVIHCVRVPVSRNVCVCARMLFPATRRYEFALLDRDKGEEGEKFRSSKRGCLFRSERNRIPCTVTRANNYSFSPASTKVNVDSRVPAFLFIPSFRTIYTCTLVYHVSLSFFSACVRACVCLILYKLDDWITLRVFNFLLIRIDVIHY